MALTASVRAGEVAVKLPDGTTLQVKVGRNGMPDPVKTSLFTVDEAAVLMNSKEGYALWAIGGESTTSDPLDFTIEPLQLPGRSERANHWAGTRYSFQGWRSDQDEAAWRWLDDPGTTYFPVRVTAKDGKTGQVVSAMACGAYTPQMKDLIRNAIQWRLMISYTLPDGTFCEIPTHSGRVLHADLPAFKVEELTLQRDPAKGWIWCLELDVKAAGAEALVLTSPLDPGWQVRLPLAGAGKVTLRFAPQSEGGPMWRWLEDHGDAPIPLRVEVLRGAESLGLALDWAMGTDTARKALESAE